VEFRPLFGLECDPCQSSMAIFHTAAYEALPLSSLTWSLEVSSLLAQTAVSLSEKKRRQRAADLSGRRRDVESGGSQGGRPDPANIISCPGSADNTFSCAMRVL
jgi:hypothetical protein